MQGKTLIKLLIVAAIAVFVWKKGIPWWNEHHSGTSATSAADDSCVSAAVEASEAWGSSIGRFANPPYDLSAWGDLQSRVEHDIRNAEGKCRCMADSCTTAGTAMSELRSLVNELDGSIRSGGPPPSDAVQRQEAIDNAINSARDLAHQGK